MSRRQIPWVQARANLKEDRAARPEVREELLRCRYPRAVQMSCWRGRSGRRYVVMVHVIGATVDVAGALGLAVSRDPAGRAELLAVGTLERPTTFLAAAVRRGATEVHLYRLADTPAELVAACEDLAPLPNG